MMKAILSTLAYADIFDYPLTKKEISRFLISESPQKLITLPDDIGYKDGFYFLKGREKIVAIRKKREEFSRQKLNIALRVASWLKLIPTIKMIGITGALAMNNAGGDDDIDLLIVTGENRLWLTRLLATAIVELVASRRRPKDKIFRDKICLNMFLDERYLAVPKKERDLFTAHEVCQLRPIYGKNGIYKKFLEKNLWVKKYLPNWKP